MHTTVILLAVSIVANIAALVVLSAQKNLIKGLKKILNTLTERMISLELRDLMAKRYIRNLESRLAEYEPDAYEKKKKIELPPCMKDMPSHTCNCYK